MILVEKVRKLESKLFAAQDVCERVIKESSGSSPSAQLAKQILDCLKEGE